MSDDARECAAAFFRSRGKDFVTPKEFDMTVSLDLKWMSVKEARALRERLLSEGAVTQSGGYIRPAGDLSGINVSIAYRPPKSLIETVRKSESQVKQEDMFPEMVEAAVKAGMTKGGFISECNRVRKRLGVEIVAAGLLVLRDAGADISEMAERAYRQIASGKH